MVLDQFRMIAFHPTLQLEQFCKMNYAQRSVNLKSTKRLELARVRKETNRRQDDVGP